MRLNYLHGGGLLLRRLGVSARLYSYGPYFPGVFGWLRPFRGILLVLSHGKNSALEFMLVDVLLCYAVIIKFGIDFTTCFHQIILRHAQKSSHTTASDSIAHSNDSRASRRSIIIFQ